MSFDFMKARRAFEEYLNEYDRDDEKIKLKIVHTYGVVAVSYTHLTLPTNREV